MKTAFYLIISLLSILTLFRCEKEVEEPLSPLNAICIGNIILIRNSDTYCFDTLIPTGSSFEFHGGIFPEYEYERLCLDTFNINISNGYCELTFADDKYYHLRIHADLEHYNINYDIPNKVLLWSKFITTEEKGTFNYSYAENDYEYYVNSITFYPENKEQYSTFTYFAGGGWFVTRYTYFSIPYSVPIEDSMKFCTEYENDTLSSQFVCIKDTILNIHKFKTKLIFKDCLRFKK